MAMATTREPPMMPATMRPSLVLEDLQDLEDLEDLGDLGVPDDCGVSEEWIVTMSISDTLMPIVAAALRIVGEPSMRGRI